MSGSDLYDIAFEARIRLRRGQTAEDLASELVSASFGRAESEAASIQAFGRRQTNSKQANRTVSLLNIGLGGALFIAGLLVTIVSVSNGDGLGIIAYG